MSGGYSEAASRVLAMLERGTIHTTGNQTKILLIQTARVTHVRGWVPVSHGIAATLLSHGTTAGRASAAASIQ